MYAFRLPFGKGSLPKFQPLFFSEKLRDIYLVELKAWLYFKGTSICIDFAQIFKHLSIFDCEIN